MLQVKTTHSLRQYKITDLTSCTRFCELNGKRILYSCSGIHCFIGELRWIFFRSDVNSTDGKRERVIRCESVIFCHFLILGNQYTWLVRLVCYRACRKTLKFESIIQYDEITVDEICCIVSMLPFCSCQ